MNQQRTYGLYLGGDSELTRCLWVGVMCLLAAGCAAKLPIQILGSHDQPIEQRFTVRLMDEFNHSSQFRIARSAGSSALTATIEEIRPIDQRSMGFHWVIRISLAGVPVGISEGDCADDAITACARTAVADTRFFVRPSAGQSSMEVRRLSASKLLFLNDNEVTSGIRILSLGKWLGDFYPEALRRQGILGEVLCRITIDAQGRVIHAEVVNGATTDRRLRTAALHLAMAYQFDNFFHRAVVTTLPIKFSTTPIRDSGSN